MTGTKTAHEAILDLLSETEEWLTQNDIAEETRFSVAHIGVERTGLLNRGVIERRGERGALEYQLAAE